MALGHVRSTTCTDRKGSENKKGELPDDMLVGFVQEMGPPELRTRLYLNSPSVLCTSCQAVSLLPKRRISRASQMMDVLDRGSLHQKPVLSELERLDYADHTSFVCKLETIEDSDIEVEAFSRGPARHAGL